MSCSLAVNCTDEPPERPETGTWEWNRDIGYEASITFTCGPYGNFEDAEGSKYNLIDSVCAWNKSWTPSQLDPCVAASCQVSTLFSLRHNNAIFTISGYPLPT